MYTEHISRREVILSRHKEIVSKVAEFDTYAASYFSRFEKRLLDLIFIYLFLTCGDIPGESNIELTMN